MAEVNLIIQGESYPITCDSGQESRVIALGKYLDRQITDLARTGAATERNRLLVLTGLILADRIDELQAALDAQPASYDVPPPAPQRLPEDDESEIVEAINQLAGRIDSVAARLQKI